MTLAAQKKKYVVRNKMTGVEHQSKRMWSWEYDDFNKGLGKPPDFELISSKEKNVTIVGNYGLDSDGFVIEDSPL